MGLVGPVPVYCDLVRWKVGSSASISVWQHMQFSEQIRPRDTLACCWLWTGSVCGGDQTGGGGGVVVIRPVGEEVWW